MRHLLVMGVCGTGKTTVAEALASRLDATFVEADAYHSEAAVARMHSGQPLTDDHRWDWLDRIAAAASAAPGPAIIACSALKSVYRARLRETLGDIAVIHLHGARPLLAARMAAREDHFMPASLLDSQFALLEPPTRGAVLAIDVAQDRETVLAQALDFAADVIKTT